MLKQDRSALDSDYLLYRLNYLVYHLNHYSPVLELDDVIVKTAREARMAMALSSHEHLFTCRFRFHLQSQCCGFWSARKALICYFKVAFTFFLDHCFAIPAEIAAVKYGKRRSKNED